MNRSIFIMSILILLVMSITIQSSVVWGQGNPLISGKKKQKTVEKSHYPPLIQKILTEINKIQREINSQLTKLARDLKESKSSKSFLLLTLFSFLYGIVHAIGPGHGKIITSSYFLTRSAKIGKGFFLGFLIAFFHTLSAILIVLSIYFLIKKSYLTNIENVSGVIQQISYAAIALVGLFILVTAVRELINSEDHDEPEVDIKNRSILMIALVVGMVPCPGAILILLFSISLQILNIGMFLAFIYSVGMGITISLIGVLTILTRQKTLQVIESRKKFIDILHHGMELAGASFIFIFGLLMFIGSNWS